MSIQDQCDQVNAQMAAWMADDPRRLQLLAELIVAIPLSRSLQSADIAEHILRDVQDSSIAQMLRRFYMNTAVSWEKYYVPFLQQLLRHLTVSRYTLIFDTTDIGPAHRAVGLSLAYQQRSLPLVWHIEPGRKGHTRTAIQVQLVQQLTQHLTFTQSVLFLGDGEFDGVPLLQLFDTLGWDFVCRTSPTVYIYPPDQPGFPLRDLVPAPDCPAQEWADVAFTTQYQFGPVHCYTCWETPHTAPLLLIYRLTTSETPRAAYQPRFWTEPLFRDCKEGGFRLNTTPMQQPERLSRLLLVVATAYLWLTCVGASVIATGVAATVDRAKRRTLSVFKTGWRWFKRQHKLGHSVTFTFKLPHPFILPPLRYLKPKLE